MTDLASRTLLVAVARAAIDAAVRGSDAPAPADAPILRERRGVFVTVKHAGVLRGCIGRIDPDEPLSSLLPAMAILAATGDPRFPRVRPAELSALSIEISLLTLPELITEPSAIEVGRHGLIVSASGRRGLLLPQVAVEHGWTAAEFLSQTCMKASLSADAWREKGVRVHTFETEIVGE